MKTINDFIVEKLRLSKTIDIVDNKHDTSNITKLSDLYQVGDKCILVSTSGHRNQEKVTLAVVEVKRILKIKIEITYIYEINDKRHSNVALKNSTYNRGGTACQEYLIIDGMSSVSMLIPANECSDFLDIIQKNNFKFDWFTAVYSPDGIYAKPKQNNLVSVKKLKDNASYIPSYDDYEDLTKDDILEIKEYL